MRAIVSTAMLLLGALVLCSPTTTHADDATANQCRGAGGQMFAPNTVTGWGVCRNGKWAFSLAALAIASGAGSGSITVGNGRIDPMLTAGNGSSTIGNGFTGPMLTAEEKVSADYCPGLLDHFNYWWTHGFKHPRYNSPRC